MRNYVYFKVIHLLSPVEGVLFLLPLLVHLSAVSMAMKGGEENAVIKALANDWYLIPCFHLMALYCASFCSGMKAESFPVPFDNQ